MEYFLYILLAIIILLVMVTIHEFGHYTIGRLLHFKIDEFSVGFGPKLISRKNKKGIVWSLRLLPLGGFCAFAGEEDDEIIEPQKIDVFDENVSQTEQSKSDTKTELKETIPTDELSDKANGVSVIGGLSDSTQKSEVAVQPLSAEVGQRVIGFNEQKPWKRVLVLLGGVLFNFISAIIFSFIYIWAVGYQVPVITNIYSDEAGNQYVASLRVGDAITAVNGRKIGVLNNFTEISQGIKEGETVVLTVDRDGNLVNIEAKKQSITYDNKGTKSTYVGFGFSSQVSFRGNSFSTAATYAVPYTGKLSWTVLGAFGDLLTGQTPITSMTGPVGTIDLIAKVSLADWRNILLLLPLLASNLAIFNILPIPALDGSKIVFTVIEWIRKKPLNRKVENIIHFVGMILIFAFVIVVDIIGMAVR